MCASNNSPRALRHIASLVAALVTTGALATICCAPAAQHPTGTASPSGSPTAIPAGSMGPLPRTDPIFFELRTLESFIQRATGPNADPELTPRAMFRLALLYELRAREGDVEKYAETARPAIDLFKRIVREYPRFEQLPVVYYELGLALHRSERVLESQQVLRGLACADLYPYTAAPDPKDSSRDSIRPLRQSHEPGYWEQWRRLHPTPASLGKGGEEERFIDPYPDTCKPAAPAPLSPAHAARLFHAWWLIGTSHFDEMDPADGPYALNRAASAFKRAIASSTASDPQYSSVLYKLAWTYYKQQRYAAAVQTFVQLLEVVEAQRAPGNDSSLDLRQEATTYCGASLTFVDFVGPREDEPFIVRSDTLDLESNPKVAETKMRVGIARTQDPAIVPQAQPWTPDIYRALATEYRELGQLRNATDVEALISSKWPGRGAPHAAPSTK